MMIYDIIYDFALGMLAGILITGIAWYISERR